MSEFKVNDVVRLKSGGPKKTVTEINGEEVKCLWTDKDGIEHNKVYDTSCLESGDARNKRNAAAHSTWS